MLRFYDLEFTKIYSTTAAEKLVIICKTYWCRYENDYPKLHESLNYSYFFSQTFSIAFLFAQNDKTNLIENQLRETDCRVIGVAKRKS